MPLFENGSREAFHVYTTFEDITARKQYEKLIQHQAYLDNLTRLPNRRNLEEKFASCSNPLPKTNLKTGLFF